MENAGISEATIALPHQEKMVPEKNLIASFDKLFYTAGLVTHKSNIRGTNAERPLSERTERAQLFKQFKSVDEKNRNQRKEILAKAHARDEIYRQYLNQGEVKVNLPGLGEQIARYVVINPPESRKTAETNLIRPIYIIPGVSNDLDSVGALGTELPFVGRKVVILGFPESFLGKVTPEFTKAVAASSTYGPHAEFYKSALLKLAAAEGDINNMEVWGYSSGAPILEEILNDPNFQQRVGNAVLICPGSTVNQTKLQLGFGLMQEIKTLAGHLRNVPKYTLTYGSKTAMYPGQKERKGEVFDALLNRLNTQLDLWKKARVKKGGRIIVVSGSQDQLTKSYEVFNSKPETIAELKMVNPQIDVLEHPGSHAYPLIHPGPVVDRIFRMQKAA